MRVVVTGASGDFGSAVLPHLRRGGHEVVGLSRHRPANWPSVDRFVEADIRDADSLADAFAGADAIVHLAWTTHPLRSPDATRAIDVGGTGAVVDAMSRAGVGRLVFSSSVLAYGTNADNPQWLTEADPLRPDPRHLYAVHKKDAEELIARSGVAATLVRAANLMGRSSQGVTREGFGAPVALGLTGSANRMQYLHPDDLGRFIARAVGEPGWLGPVNLATVDAITMAEVAQLLGKRYVQTSEKTLMRATELLWRTHLLHFGPGEIAALTNFPAMDVTRLREEFGFELGWSSSRDCVIDFARNNRTHVFLGQRRVELPWRWPYAPVPDRDAVLTERVGASHADLVGEFDSSVDPGWAVYTADNTSEAFPGPMTPLSLEFAYNSLQAAGAQAADILRFDGEVKRVLTYEQVGVFGHGVYANLSVIFALSTALPGGGAEDWERLFGDTSKLVAQLDPISKSQMARRLPWIAARALTYGRIADELADRARAERRSAAQLAALSDAELEARLGVVMDEGCNTWATACQGGIFVTAILGAIEKQAGAEFTAGLRGGTDKLASAGAVRGVRRLADLARADQAITAILREEKPEAALNRIRSEAPAFAAELDGVITDYGHRGPRETELSNPVFADAPERLLDSVAKLVSSPVREVEPLPRLHGRLRLLATIGAGVQQARERLRDAAVCYTHQYRLAARERGQRLVARGVLDDPADAFYLVLEELQNPPADIRARVVRRREERARLQALKLPRAFHLHWEPVEEAISLAGAGDALTGTGVSAGRATGRVRVLTAESVDDLEPGEVLVTKYTDTGWTPFFAFASAVVVDTGGQMSHAAVVAREFGIPCVVNTGDASERLITGQLVCVDGATGQVQVMADTAVV